MSGAERPTFITVLDYLAQEELAATKSEYVNGWVRAMVGSTIRHNSVAGNCFLALGTALKGRRCRPFNSDTKLRIELSGSTQFYYPDLQVVCESNAADAIYQDQPVLLIEVLSPSTRRYDLDEKMIAYLTIPSLECYLVLEQHKPMAIVMRKTEKGFVRELVEGTHAVIDLPFLSCTLTMSDIYDSIEFTSECVQELEEEYATAKSGLNG